jgi:hypothetical protein
MRPRGGRLTGLAPRLAYLHYGRMAKRRSLVQKKGAAVCTALCTIDEARRYELGVEAICQLTTDVLAIIRAKNHDTEALVMALSDVQA